MCDQTINHQLSPNTHDSIFDLAARLEQSYHRLNSILGKLESRDYDPAALAAERETLAEIRKHLALAERTVTTIVEIHANEEFQKAVIQALGEASPKVQKRVLDILAARKDTDR